MRNWCTKKWYNIVPACIVLCAIRANRGVMQKLQLRQVKEKKDFVQFRFANNNLI